MNGGRTIKSEAFFWANSPSEANAYAVEYWKRFDGTMDPYSSQNVDGKQTKDGFCHESFGIYGHGSVSMNVIVSDMDGPSGGWGVMAAGGAEARVGRDGRRGRPGAAPDRLHQQELEAVTVTVTGMVLVLERRVKRAESGERVDVGESAKNERNERGI